jgi:hypothetical protein
MKLRLPIALAFISLLAGAQDRPPGNVNGAQFACNRLALDPAARQRHFEVLGPALRSMHRQIRELPDGFEFEFPADPPAVQKIAEWAAGERLCCPFFDIDLRFPHDGGGLLLRLTGRRGVKEFIQADFDRWFRQ